MYKTDKGKTKTRNHRPVNIYVIPLLHGEPINANKCYIVKILRLLLLVVVLFAFQVMECENVGTMLLILLTICAHVVLLVCSLPM